MKRGKCWMNGVVGGMSELAAGENKNPGQGRPGFESYSTVTNLYRLWMAAYPRYAFKALL
jgi:hypothetical protein